MTAKAYATAGKTSKFGTAKSCGKNRKALRTNVPVVRVARQLFTLKTAQVLSDLTGYEVRTCEYWISPTNPTAIPGDALVSLLRSDFGREFLDEIMRGSRAPWWQRALSYFGIIDAMRFQRRARNKLKAAIDADDDLATAIARSEASLAVQDEDFAGAHFDGHRAPGGILHRTVAAKGRGR